MLANLEIKVKPVSTGPFRFGEEDPEDVPRPPWQPNADEDGTPNPQRLALESEADELYYGGAAGGGKTDLLLGCALTRHKKAAIFRRVNPNLDSIIDRSIDIVGDDAAYNRTYRVWRLPYVTLEFESCQHEHDKKKQQGRPRDFYGFDEITEFSRSQYQFIIGWNRTTDQGQRRRVIVTGNPPLDSAGMWVIEEWAPWLDDKFPNPAEPGELRWYYHDSEGDLHWLESGEPIEVDGEMVRPRSRTFIPALLSDNPHLASDGEYLSVLNALPEPMRTLFKTGDFRKLVSMDPFQVIPSEWVLAAQRRWRELERPSTSPDVVGVDVARGGNDKTVFAPRWGEYFGDVEKYPGLATPDGPTVAALFWEQWQRPGAINVDVIGVGSSAYDSLAAMYTAVYPVNVSTASTYRDKSGKLRMRNLRSELHWRMRDALDPESGVELALPDNREVLADLCSARYKPLMGGVVEVESKEDIKARLGRSPDVGDALLLANLEMSAAPLPEQPQQPGRWQVGEAEGMDIGGKWRRY